MGWRYINVYFICFVIVNIVLVSYLSGQNEKVFKAAVDKDGVQRVDILGGKYFFDPSYIIVKVNMPVELQVRKEKGFVPHNIIMNEPEAGIEFNEELKTEQKLIRFTPEKIGKHPFYCDKKLLFFKGHREKGMNGILEVIE